MWKTINKVLDKHTSSGIPSSLELDGKCLTKDLNILQAFNHHFTSVVPKLAEKIEDRNGDDCLQNISAETSSDMSVITIDEN